MKKFLQTMSILLLASSLLLLTTACDSSDYKKAVELYEYGQYDQAIAMFEQLGDYKDSAQMVQTCTYGKAKSFYDAGKYAEAIPLFEKTQDYQDSADLIKKAKVLLAEAEYNKGNLTEAVTLLIEVKDLEAAQNLLHKIMFDEINETYIEYLEDGINLVNDCLETFKSNLYKKLYSGQTVVFSVSSFLSTTDKDVVALKELRTKMTDFYTAYHACFSEEVLAQCDEKMVKADEVFTKTHKYAVSFYDPFGARGFGQWLLSTVSGDSVTYSVDGLMNLVKDLEKALNAL